MPEEVQRDDYLMYRCHCGNEFFDEEDCRDCEKKHKTKQNG